MKYSLITLNIFGIPPYSGCEERSIIVQLSLQYIFLYTRVVYQIYIWSVIN